MVTDHALTYNEFVAAYEANLPNDPRPEVLMYSAPGADCATKAIET